MEIRFGDNPDQNRYEIFVDGERAGLTQYHLRQGRISFTHTEIEDRFEGQGLGGRLVKAALDDARARGLRVLPFCPFVNSYLERHPEYRDLVPETERPRFNL